MSREDVFYQAMLARDPRFDGKFFVGVKTTGIYCRPICPARPKRQNVEFFRNHLEAERAGYRPCMRCHPESAPQSPTWIGKTALVQRAVKVLHNRDTIELNEDCFAELFGVSARHLRRLFVDEIGKTPKQLSFENRLNLARKLLKETTLPITEVAFAAGFSSIRRFNDAFKERFKKNPSQSRSSQVNKSHPLRITQSYRPPFDFEGLLRIYKSHRVANLEWFEDDKMHRVVELDGKVGTISIANDSQKARLVIEIDFSDTSIIHGIISKVRSLFDLDSDPVTIANSLEVDPQVKKILKKHPGIRLPSGWDPFEIAVSTILGQLVSIERGRALVYDLVELLGKEVKVGDKLVKLFPSPQKIASADLTNLKSTTARKQTLKAFSNAVARGEISLEPTQDVEEFLAKILAIKGIGPWSANYMALKVLRHTDSFPHTDLILARALELHSADLVNQMRPWRGYAAALFWREYSTILKKTKRRLA